MSDNEDKIIMMTTQPLDALAARSRHVRTALEMTEYDRPSAQEAGALLFETLSERRATLIRQLAARKCFMSLPAREWPRAEGASLYPAQVDVISTLMAECEHLEWALGGLAGA